MGCGFKKLQGYWNVDSFEGCDPDEVFDFEESMWPWVDNSFERIHVNNCLEHLGQTPKQFLNVIKEMYRVSKDGCVNGMSWCHTTDAITNGMILLT